MDGLGGDCVRDVIEGLEGAAGVGGTVAGHGCAIKRR